LRPIAIGIAYEINRCEFATEAHDVALDEIITETSPMQNPPASQ
jgi:5-formyltetrahydrofolate cyclo-ligase